MVSLCRLGVERRPRRRPWKRATTSRSGSSTTPTRTKNPNLDFVLNDAAGAVAAFRAEGKTVLLHCVQAQSRTPTVAALYGARLTGHTALKCLGDIQRCYPTRVPTPPCLPRFIGCPSVL